MGIEIYTVWFVDQRDELLFSRKNDVLIMA